MRYHVEIISYWPSPKDLASDIGENPDTVRKWKERGRIPSDSWEDIVDAAQRRNYPVDLQKLASVRRRKKRVHQ